MGRGFHIGKVARETGLTSGAIRFYERAGLLKPPQRTERGLRIYDENAVSELKFICRARERGFTLEEIRELLGLRRSGTKACSHVMTLVRRKLANVRAKRQELEGMERGLSHDVVECQRALRRRHTGRGQHCPLLAKLEQPSGFAAQAAEMT